MLPSILAKEIISSPAVSVGYHQKGTGQFFTPFDIARLLATLNMGSTPLPSDRLTRICDPAVGAGGGAAGIRQSHL